MLSWQLHSLLTKRCPIFYFPEELLIEVHSFTDSYQSVLVGIN